MGRMKQPSAAGGWHALKYTLRMARRVGPLKLYRAMTARNACKTCALGMGGQLGGMRNEQGHFPEVCKKSLQAMAADMQGALSDDFFSTYTLAQLRGMSPRELETSGRLVRPLYLGPQQQKFRPISWEEALIRITDKLKATRPEESFFYFSGRSSNEAGFLLQLMARVYGTNHVNNCSYYCHQASGVGLSQAIGTSAGTVQVADIEDADLFFLIGGNPASNHPRLMTHLMHMRRRGGRVIVVNPVRELGLMRFRIPSDVRSMLFGTKIATDFVQVRIGGDIAFMTGLAKALLARHALDKTTLDQTFITTSTTDFAALQTHVESVSWSEIEQSSGITQLEIERIADLYARSQRTIFGWTMGITHHQHGTQNVQWITNLALMRGMLGKAHAGLLPIRGHSNVQGMGTVGVTPALKDAIFQRFVAAGLQPPTHKGLDTMGCMDAAMAGKMRFGMALGGNLQGSNPDASYATRSLEKLDMMVYLNTSLNTGHAHGTGKETLILPVLARDEEPYSTTQESMFSYVRLSDGGEPRHVLQDHQTADSGPRGEVTIIAALATKLFGLEAQHGPVKWRDLTNADKIRGLMAQLIPGLEQVADIAKNKREFFIPGRDFTGRQAAVVKGMNGLVLPTFSGKAHFFAHPLPSLAALAPDELRLMTVRSEGQFNTVVYEDDDLYRGQDRRDVILLHPDDMRRLGLEPDQRIAISSSAGEMRRILARPFDIKPGHALMYYPEANVLLDRRLDPQSLTPAFKSMVIRIRAEVGAYAQAGDLQPATKPTGISLGTSIKGWLRKRFRPAVKSC